MEATSSQIAALIKPFDHVDIANDMGVENTTVWRWQEGKRLPNRSMLPKLSEATGIPLEDLRAARRADRAAQREAAAR